MQAFFDDGKTTMGDQIRTWPNPLPVPHIDLIYGRIVVVVNYVGRSWSPFGASLDKRECYLVGDICL